MFPSLHLPKRAASCPRLHPPHARHSIHAHPAALSPHLRFDFGYLTTECAVLTALTQASFLAFIDSKLLAPDRRLLGVWIYSIGTPTPAAAAGPALAPPPTAPDAMRDSSDDEGDGKGSESKGDGEGEGVAATPAPTPDWIAVAAGLADDAVVLGPAADLSAFHAAHPVFVKPATL
jgi:hypothetical protein